MSGKQVKTVRGASGAAASAAAVESPAPGRAAAAGAPPARADVAKQSELSSYFINQEISKLSEEKSKLVAKLEVVSQENEKLRVMVTQKAQSVPVQQVSEPLERQNRILRADILELKERNELLERRLHDALLGSAAGRAGGLGRLGTGPATADDGIDSISLSHAAVLRRVTGAFPNGPHNGEYGSVYVEYSGHSVILRGSRPSRDAMKASLLAVAVEAFEALADRSAYTNTLLEKLESAQAAQEKLAQSTSVQEGIIDALQKSHAEERRAKEDTIVALQSARSRIGVLETTLQAERELNREQRDDLLHHLLDLDGEFGDNDETLRSHQHKLQLSRRAVRSLESENSMLRSKLEEVIRENFLLEEELTVAEDSVPHALAGHDHQLRAPQRKRWEIGWSTRGRRTKEELGGTVGSEVVAEEPAAWGRYTSSPARSPVGARNRSRRSRTAEAAVRRSSLTANTHKVRYIQTGGSTRPQQEEWDQTPTRRECSPGRRRFTATPQRCEDTIGEASPPRSCVGGSGFRAHREVFTSHPLQTTVEGRPVGRSRDLVTPVNDENVDVKQLQRELAIATEDNRRSREAVSDLRQRLSKTEQLLAGVESTTAHLVRELLNSSRCGGGLLSMTAVAQRSTMSVAAPQSRSTDLVAGETQAGLIMKASSADAPVTDRLRYAVRLVEELQVSFSEAVEFLKNERDAALASCCGAPQADLEAPLHGESVVPADRVGKADRELQSKQLSSVILEQENSSLRTELQRAFADMQTIGRAVKEARSFSANLEKDLRSEQRRREEAEKSSRIADERRLREQMEFREREATLEVQVMRLTEALRSAKVSDASEPLAPACAPPRSGRSQITPSGRGSSAVCHGRNENLVESPHDEWSYQGLNESRLGPSSAVRSHGTGHRMPVSDGERRGPGPTVPYTNSRPVHPPSSPPTSLPRFHEAFSIDSFAPALDSVYPLPNDPSMAPKQSQRLTANSPTSKPDVATSSLASKLFAPPVPTVT